MLISNISRIDINQLEEEHNKTLSAHHFFMT